MLIKPHVCAGSSSEGSSQRSSYSGRPCLRSWALLPVLISSSSLLISPLYVAFSPPAVFHSTPHPPSPLPLLRLQGHKETNMPSLYPISVRISVLTFLSSPKFLSSSPSLFFSLTSFQQRSQLTALWTGGRKKKQNNNESTDRASPLHVQQHFLVFKDGEGGGSVHIACACAKGEKLEGWEMKSRDQTRRGKSHWLRGADPPPPPLFCVFLSIF